MLSNPFVVTFKPLPPASYIILLPAKFIIANKELVILEIEDHPRHRHTSDTDFIKCCTYNDAFDLELFKAHENHRRIINVTNG